MNPGRSRHPLARLLRLLALLLLWSACACPASPTVSATDARSTEQTAPLPNTLPLQAESKRGYGLNLKGLNYDDDSLQKAIDLGWEWVKIYDHPPAERLPFKVLFRVNLPHTRDL